jgi:hypothetical protein
LICAFESLEYSLWPFRCTKVPMDPHFVWRAFYVAHVPEGAGMALVRMCAAQNERRPATT